MLLAPAGSSGTARVCLAGCSDNLCNRRHQSPLSPFYPNPIPSGPLSLSWAHIDVVARTVAAPSFSSLLSALKGSECWACNPWFLQKQWRGVGRGNICVLDHIAEPQSCSGPPFV